MRNVQIGDNDLIGHKFNGHDLHIYLKDRGVKSDHLVWKKHSNDPSTFEIAYELEGREALHAYSVSLEKQLAIQARTYGLSQSILSSQIFLDADIVHYHLIHNHFFDLSILPTLTKLKPSVWTIHDPWILSGHCIYPLGCDKWQRGCGDCPDLDVAISITSDTTAINWEIKREIIENSNVEFIVASKYMYDLLKVSPITYSKKIHLIPFGLDLDKFKNNCNKSAKKSLGIEEQEIVLSLRATQSPFKGLNYVYKALDKLEAQKPVCILTFNEKGLFDHFRHKYKVIDLGWVFDDKTMINAYNASDIFLMPSTAEAFGMMAMEAMACSKPSIVFEDTALPEVIKDPDGGIAVPMGDVNGLVKAIEELVENDSKRLAIGNQARAIAESFYDKDIYVNDIISVYEEVIKKREISDRVLFITQQLKKYQNESKEIKMASREDQVKTNDANHIKEQKIQEMKSYAARIINNKYFGFIFLKFIYPIVKIMFKFHRLLFKKDLY